MNTVKGTFKRKSPVSFYENVDPPVGWFVISHNWIDSKKDRRDTHGKWHKIKSDNKTIYRVLRYSVQLSYSSKENKGDIVLDWMGWIDLNNREEEVNKPIELTIQKARLFEIPFCGLSHPDLAYRLSVFLAILSVFLGILSLLLAIFL